LLLVFLQRLFRKNQIILRFYRTGRTFLPTLCGM
jgi:hypothetical protein